RGNRRDHLHRKQLPGLHRWPRMALEQTLLMKPAPTEEQVGVHAVSARNLCHRCARLQGLLHDPRLLLRASHPSRWLAAPRRRHLLRTFIKSVRVHLSSTWTRPPCPLQEEQLNSSVLAEEDGVVRTLTID